MAHSKKYDSVSRLVRGWWKQMAADRRQKKNQWPVKRSSNPSFLPHIETFFPQGLMTKTTPAMAVIPTMPDAPVVVQHIAISRRRAQRARCTIV